MANNIEMTVYMDIAFKDEKYKECQDIFNELCSVGQYPAILEYSAIELHQKSENTISVARWREFLLHPSVVEWFEEEQRLLMRQKANKMIKNMDNNTHTSQQQGLASILNLLDKGKDTQKQSDIIIYQHVPLSPQEKENPNIHVLQSVPDTIENSYQIVGNSNKRN